VPGASNRQPPEIGIDITTAHPARVQNFLSGGDAHFSVDREAIEQATAVLPGGLEAGRKSVRSMAAFHARALRYLVVEAGIGQFLKLGTAVPVGDDVHEITQSAAPGTRVVYVGDDPTVLAHAHALRSPESASDTPGATAYVHGGIRDVDLILEQAALTLDLERPVALVLPATLNFVASEDDPYGIVADFVERVASGSYLVLTHITREVGSDEAMSETARRFSKLLGKPFVIRDRDEIAGFLTGLEPVEPGLVLIDQWQPPSTGTPSPAGSNDPPPDEPDGRPTPIYACVARKP
jgi:hypothetical protein